MDEIFIAIMEQIAQEMPELCWPSIVTTIQATHPARMTR